MRSVLWLLSLALAVLGATLPLQAEQIQPPANGHLLTGGSEGVLFSWPGSDKGTYFLQIYAGSAAAVEQHVTGNRVLVPLRAGLGYQWKVSLLEKPGSYQEIVSHRSFQVIGDSSFRVTGFTGAAGGPGTSRSGYNGSEGDRGQPGPKLTATLAPLGDYVELTITGPPAVRRFLFAPGAAPFLLASLGGQGGPGGMGYRGRDGVIDLNTGYITPPEPGGNGGSGGDGGPGGEITVVSNGLEIDRYLQFDTRGGEGGDPGQAGPGGTGVNAPPEWRYRLPQGASYGATRAPSGVPGRPGRPGAEGQVFRR